MAIFYPSIERSDSRLDVCVKGYYYGAERAREIQAEVDELKKNNTVANSLEGRRRLKRLLGEIDLNYENILGNMRAERTIILKALFYGATREEVDAAIAHPSTMEPLRLLSRVRRRHKKTFPQNS